MNAPIVGMELHKFSFSLNFIYHIKIDTNIKNENNVPSGSEEIISFLLSVYIKSGNETNLYSSCCL